MTEIFGPGWFEIILQQQVASSISTLISIKAQRDAYRVKALQFKLELECAQRELELQNKIFENRVGRR